jgi:hypothetical protein
VYGVRGERAAWAYRLSQLAVGISSGLVDLEMFPVRDISQFLKSA